MTRNLQLIQNETSACQIQDAEPCCLIKEELRVKLGLKALNRLIIVTKQQTDRYVLEIQKAQITVYYICSACR